MAARALEAPRLVGWGGWTGDGGRNAGLTCRQQQLQGQGPHGLVHWRTYLAWAPFWRDPEALLLPGRFQTHCEEVSPC